MGKFDSKPLVHLLEGGALSACGLYVHRPRHVDGNYPATTGAWSEVTCGSCKRTTAWKNAKGKDA
jgi:hypothetical protein